MTFREGDRVVDQIGMHGDVIGVDRVAGVAMVLVRWDSCKVNSVPKSELKLVEGRDVA